MNMQEPMIKVRQLKIAFGEKVVLKDVSFDVYPGETLAVIGPSGTGKSTVMKVLTGLLQPTVGSVLIKGQEVSDFTAEEQWDALRVKMGVVFQYSALFDFLTVGENVAFGLRQHYQLPEDEISSTVSKLLELVGMPDTESLMPAELSGGMKKRVGLARALAMRPELVFYDEPTSGLDPVMTMNISRLIRKTQQRMGVASILISHDMESVFYAADRIAMLYEGRIIQVGTVDEIKNSDNKIVQAFINGRDWKEVNADE